MSAPQPFGCQPGGFSGRVVSMLAEGPFSSPSLPWRSFPCSTRARASQGRKGQAKPVGAPREPEERPSEEKPSFPPDTYHGSRYKHRGELSAGICAAGKREVARPISEGRPGGHCEGPFWPSNSLRNCSRCSGVTAGPTSVCLPVSAPSDRRREHGTSAQRQTGTPCG